MKNPGDIANDIARRVSRESINNSEAIKPMRHDLEHMGFKGYILSQSADKLFFENKYNKTGGIKQMVVSEKPEIDCIGTKIQFYSYFLRPERLKYIAEDLIGSTADDLARSGRKPLWIASDIHLKQITEENLPLFTAMMEGYGEALEKTELVNLTTKIAILKYGITAFCDRNSSHQLILNWSATCHGLVHEEKLLDGSKIKPGMPIVGLLEPSIRINGGTYIADLVKALYEKGEVDAAMQLISKTAMPSKIYCNLINYTHGWLSDGSIQRAIATIAGIAHITGGGIWKKLGEILPPGVGALLNNMPKHLFLIEIQALSQLFNHLKLGDFEMMKKFHGGCGMHVICETEQDADLLIDLAGQFDIKAQKIGKTIQSHTNEIIIHSRFLNGGRISSKQYL